jgi:hypothetical protein
MAKFKYFLDDNNKSKLLKMLKISLNYINVCHASHQYIVFPAAI